MKQVGLEMTLEGAEDRICSVLRSAGRLFHVRGPLMAKVLYFAYSSYITDDQFSF